MEVLYNIFIMPLIYMLEILIHILRPILALNPVSAIFIISIVMNSFCYPIFAKIEDLIKEDNDKYQKLLPKINSIKKNFYGYERRMILATYFRQNNYHPLIAHFKQSLTIFLQVPFFIACYITICENNLFQTPLLDKINNSITLFNIPIKILPILMTIINIMSVKVYMKDKPLSNKIYANMLPMLFLVLLYFSPASIVLYWIFNNSFSFLRNVYFYMKDKVIITSLIYAISVISLAFFINPSLNTLYAFLTLCIIALLYKFIKLIAKDTFYLFVFLSFLSIYIIMYSYGYLYNGDSTIYYIIAIFLFIIASQCYKFIIKDKTLRITIFDYIVFLLAFVLIFFLYIPLTLINSSVLEYIKLININDLVVHLFEVGVGLFVFYLLVIFYIQKSYRLQIYYFSLIFIITSLYYLYTYKMPADAISVYAIFDINTYFSSSYPYIYEALIIASIIFIISLMLRYNVIKYINIIAVSLILVYSHLIIEEIKLIPQEKEYIHPKEEQNNNITLSTNGKNIVVLLLDRAISGFLPIIMEEKPYLKEVYTGFKYYPYTVSYAIQTLYSTPSLLGGYEYTPQTLQNDTTKKMVDKHNEAISVLPELFRKNGYNVTLYDVPFVNYDAPQTTPVYHKDITILNKRHYIERKEDIIKMIKRNSLYFIFFKMAPGIYKNKVYNKGKYFANENVLNIDNLSIKKEAESFIRLVNGINIKNNKENNYVFINSMIPHCPTLLRIDENSTLNETNNFSSSQDSIDNIIESNEKLDKTMHYVVHYNANIYAYQVVQHFIQKLKDNHIYDNTRIVIMSDHGWFLNDIENIDKEITANNSLLFVKDFNAKGHYTTEHTFMTSADVPYITAQDIGIDLINPMTNKPLLQAKEKGVDIITNYLSKCEPSRFKDKDRTYLYDGDVKYRHIDESIIKELIKIKEE